MDQVALAVDIRLHFRVPPAGTVAVVDPGIDEIFHYERHEAPSVSYHGKAGRHSPAEARGETLLRLSFRENSRVMPTLSAGRLGVKSPSEITNRDARPRHRKGFGLTVLQSAILSTTARTSRTPQSAWARQTCAGRGKTCTCSGRRRRPWRRPRPGSSRRGASRRL